MAPGDRSLLKTPFLDCYIRHGEAAAPNLPLPASTRSDFSVILPRAELTLHCKGETDGRRQICLDDLNKETDKLIFQVIYLTWRPSVIFLSLVDRALSICFPTNRHRP